MSILKALKWFMIDQFMFHVGGGGGQSAPTTTTVNQNTIPSYAQPYVESMLGAAQQQVYTTDPTTGNVSGFQPYTPYSTNMNDYQAAFSPLQQQSFNSAANLQTPGQYGAGSQLAGAAGLGSLGIAGQLANTGYNPLSASYLGASAPSLQNYQMQGPGNVRASYAQAAGFQGPEDVSAQNVNAPSLQNYQMQNAPNVSAPGMQTTNMQGAQTGYNPNLQNYQMGPASNVTTQDFTQGNTAQQYMNPYLQSSLAPQLAEIGRQYDITGTQEMSNATQQGAMGGSREALMAAENQRNKNTAMNAAIGQGYNTAFNNAQNQFNTQQQANLQAQQANQAAGINVGGQNLNAALGVQQLGTQTGMQTALANLNNEQQANVQNQAAQLQASGMNAQQAMQAALANQQSSLTTGQQNLAANLGIQQLGAQNSLQAQQLNQSAGLQAGLANQQMGYNTGLQNAQMQQQANLANQQARQQANLANQQMGYNVGNTNLQSLLGVQQLGAGQDLQSQLANQQAYAGAQQANIGQQQFGANLGLQGLQGALQGYGQAGQAAGTLGQLGTQQLAAQQGILGTQNAMGAQQQTQQQNMINQAIQNYATAQQYPMMQLGNISNLLHGLPMQSTTTQTYQAQPGVASQIAGLGAGAYGLSKLAGAKKGGSTKEISKRGTGIDEMHLHELLNYKE